MLVRKNEQAYKIGRSRDRRWRAWQREIAVGGPMNLWEGLAKANCMPAKSAASKSQRDQHHSINSFEDSLQKGN